MVEYKKIWALIFYIKFLKRSEEMFNLFLSTPTPQPEETPVWLVCLLGVSVVFVGLLCIIGLVELMTFVCNKIADSSVKKAEEKKPQAQAPQGVAPMVIENRGELVAAICAAVAEEEGTDISAIRVISLKRIQ